MHHIIVIGMNHKTAPVELRERLGADADNPRKALAWMRNLEVIREGFFLSTCNRVEALVVTDEIDAARGSVVSLMARLGRVRTDDLMPCLYVFEQMNAVRHIFKVASSLDSMVVGEPQILGQIKDAYGLATREKTSGVILNRLMHRAFHVAKRVRSETEICGSAVSISYAAVELARKIFHLLEGKKVLLLGAGEMAELAARHLLSHGVSSLMVANRTFERAVEVAGRFQATPVSFDEIGSILTHVDIVITSTASPNYVITRDEVKHCLRKRRNRPLFFIDIAVPRDVEPRVNDLGNVYLYDIDDLKGVVALNLAQRKEEAVKAGRIVEQEVGKFEKWLKTLAVVPTIVSLREKAESIIQAEYAKSRSALEPLSAAQHEAVETLIRSIVDKVLNDPIVFLKERSARPTVNTYLDLTKRLFQLNGVASEGEEKAGRGK
ncbi:MAG: glutamyl-tRNA reductase [Deltaproteobacteria bacterium]|nr:glutamyl-tRNA reductase [Deltaproteobacteria bacterium]OQX64968.1 MAG: glutamyl-tRNA reductase [Desulfococcus sp. 4484_242]